MNELWSRLRQVHGNKRVLTLATAREAIIACMDRLLDEEQRTLVTVLVSDPEESLLEFTDRLDVAKENDGIVLVIETNPIAALVMRSRGGGTWRRAIYRDPDDIVEFTEVG